MHLKSLLIALALTAQGSAFASQVLTFNNVEVDGAKVWEPSLTTLKAGEDVEIKIVNSLKDIHGFEIPGLTEKIAVPANQTRSITVKAPKAGDYAFKCHMHPKHVGGHLSIK